MSKAQQINLNMQLSEELATFIIANPKILRKYSGYSYVVFSYSNKELNELNNELVIGIINEGKNVVKAIQTSEKNSPWKFSTALN